MCSNTQETFEYRLWKIHLWVNDQLYSTEWHFINICQPEVLQGLYIWLYNTFCVGCCTDSDKGSFYSQPHSKNSTVFTTTSCYNAYCARLKEMTTKSFGRSLPRIITVTGYVFFYIYEAHWTFRKRLLLRRQERGTRGTLSSDMAEYKEFKKRQKKLGCYESTTKQPISPSLWTPCFWWDFYWKHTKTSCINYAVHKRQKRSNTASKIVTVLTNTKVE